MNPLQILGLKSGSTLDEAKQSYRQLSKKYHPDKNPSDPEAKKKFLEIQEAFVAISNQPSLLTQNLSNNFLQFVRIDLDVTVEDFYLSKEFKVYIDRQIFCKQCNGTGSKTREAGLCGHCGGVGIIKSQVLSLMNRSPVCPVCKGRGVPEENICPKCLGSKYELDHSMRKIRLSLTDYHKKGVVIKGAGNQISADSFGNAFIRLNVQPNDQVCVEDDYYSVYFKILPVQRIIGDDAVLTMFGRKISFRIEKNAVDAFTIDRVAPGITPHVRIKFIEMPPVLIEDTISLYKKILKIEKATSL